MFKLFLSNVDPQSQRAYKFVKDNKFLVQVFEQHKKEDKPYFEQYNITETPTLIYGNHKFTGIKQIEASNL